ncbi:MAG TPA: hypothetical protein VGS16_10545 [Candidatus Dormibacteraeota bacterium]|nr:hypothetical protein [Candidatus Dormibacteraeota bacterium]
MRRGRASAALSAYVAEAVARYDDYKAYSAKLLEASRTAAKAGKEPKARA